MAKKKRKKVAKKKATKKKPKPKKRAKPPWVAEEFQFSYGPDHIRTWREMVKKGPELATEFRAKAHHPKCTRKSDCPQGSEHHRCAAELTAKTAIYWEAGSDLEHALKYLTARGWWYDFKDEDVDEFDDELTHSTMRLGFAVRVLNYHDRDDPMTKRLRRYHELLVRAAETRRCLVYEHYGMDERRYEQAQEMACRVVDALKDRLTEELEDVVENVADCMTDDVNDGDFVDDY